MNLTNSILATLAYADIFNYPLRFSEIHQNLIFLKTTKDQLSKGLKSFTLKKKISQVNDYYCLQGRSSLVKIRIAREKFAKQKFEKAKFAAKILFFLPTVKLVGVSGALAVSNTPKDDDIDFFIICAANFLWTTRFFCNLFLDSFRLRRKPNDLKVADKICLNMFLTEDDLGLEPADIYLAHEILQLQPIFERNNTYYKFLKANLWVFEFLPNWPATAHLASSPTARQAESTLASQSVFSSVESFLKNFQLKLMVKRRTTETISDTKLFFHPFDIHQKVLAEFEKRLKKLEIPLDKS